MRKYKWVQNMEGNRFCITGKYEVNLESFKIDEKKLSDKEILIKTEYTMISPGTELSIFTNLEKLVHYPFYPGYISVGEVIGTGRRSDFVEGETVFSYSRHASIAKIDPAKIFCVKLPDKIKKKQAVFARIATIAMTALRVSSGELGDWAAILGLGLVGNMAAQIFALAGFNVIGIDLIEERLQIANKCGVKYTINPSTTNLKEKIFELTEDKGCEVTVEAIGNPKTIKTGLEITKRLGEIILLGTPRGEEMSDLSEILRSVHLWPKGCLTLKGAHEWRLPLYEQDRRKHSIERNTKIAFNLISEKKLETNDLITHTISPHQLKEAYKGLLSKKAEYLGVILDWKNN